MLILFSTRRLVYNCCWNVSLLICFQLIQESIHIYPDIAAYHSVAVTLGQAGLLKELLNTVECMRQKPKAFMHRKNWDPVLEPDLVIYNAVRQQLDIYHLTF